MRFESTYVSARPTAKASGEMPRVKEAAGVLNSTSLMFYLASPSCRVLSHRDFIEKRYVDLKKANSNLPILIRECSDVQPKLWARYGERGTHGWLTPWGFEEIQGHTARESGFCS